MGHWVMFLWCSPESCRVKARHISLCACVSERDRQTHTYGGGGCSHKGLSFLKPQDDSFCLPGNPDGVTLPKAMFMGRIFFNRGYSDFLEKGQHQHQKTLSQVCRNNSCCFSNTTESQAPHLVPGVSSPLGPTPSFRGEGKKAQLSSSTRWSSLPY